MNSDTMTDWPPVLLPTDRPRTPGVPARCSAVVRAELDPQTRGDDLGAPEDVLLAGFAALLHRYTGQDRIALARIDATGRGAGARLAITGESTLRQLVGAIELTDSGGSTVGIRCAAPGSPAAGEQYELQLVVRCGGSGRATLELHYDTGLFDRATVARLLGHYRTLVEDGLWFPDRPVSRLRLLTDAERRRILVDWNRTERDLPFDTCLHEAFEAVTGHQPGAVAVVAGAQRWTYAQVNASANRLAWYLRSLGVGPDVRVGLCLDRSPELLVAVLGILKAGGAYVPLDPDYPTQRIATMVEGTSCAVMISRTNLTSNLPADGGGHLLLLDRDAATLAAQPSHNPGAIAGPRNLCYIIHTSGSTGAPKPIALRHCGVMNNVADLNTRFRVGPGDAVLALSSPSFDMSVYEFLGLTIAGGTVVVPDQTRAKDPAHWAELLVAHDITVWNSAPALLGLIADHLEQTGVALPNLRLALLGGDWVPVPLPDRVRRIAPGLRFIVMGGATEASIHSTIYEVTVSDPEWTSIPYGRPMANQRTYILDEARQPVPPGVPGELYLAGIGLARGYLDQPERTAERFTEWSHGEVTNERLYRTGDLARFGPDGMIELLGRMDFQVKINGLRVELGEIEAVLRSHPEIRQTAVVARDKRLIAYVVGTAPVEELRKLAAARLPEFMVPGTFVTLDRLPLTPNGKLDRKGLPEPAVVESDYRAPTTPIELALADAVAAVLGRPRVGLDDDFIQLGGDSIRAIQVVTRARAQGIEISPRLVLQSRTVTTLASVAGATSVPTTVDATPLVEVTDDLRGRYPELVDVWPLTPMQAGMVFESLLKDTGPDAYQLQTVYHLAGEVDSTRLRAAGEALLARHQNLRAAFATDESDGLVQVVVEGVRLPWQEIDLTGVADRDQAFARFLAEDRATRFDLATPPLLRLALVRLGVERTELVLTVHHALIDGWSEQLLAQELRRLYTDNALEPARPYRDFLAWLAQQDVDKSARAWAEELAGIEGPTMLAPAGAALDIAEIVVPLPRVESERLTEYSAKLGVTPNTVVQGAWAVLLSTLTGHEDVVFGATVSGRSAPIEGVESMVGLFINTVPVRARCASRDSVAELLTSMQTRQTVLLDHQHHGLSEIHAAMGVSALFDTLVVFQSFPADTGDQGGLHITGIDSVGTGSYPVTLIVEPERLTLQYDRTRFTSGAAEDIVGKFRSVLRQMVENAGKLVGDVDVSLKRRVTDAAAGLRESIEQQVRDSMPKPAELVRGYLEKYGLAGDSGYRAGRTPDEVAMCELFAEVLGVERVGIDDDFFALGCNSLKATRIIGRMRRTLGLEASIKSIFQYSTIAELSAQVTAVAVQKSMPSLRKRT